MRPLSAKHARVGGEPVAPAPLPRLRGRSSSLRHGQRWAFLAGFIGSVLLHLLLLPLGQLFDTSRVPHGEPTGPKVAVRQPAGIRIQQIVIVAPSDHPAEPSRAAPEPEIPVLDEPAEREPVRVPVGPPAQPLVDDPVTVPSAIERMRLQMREPGLWIRAPHRTDTVVSAEDSLVSAALARLRTLHDSLSALAAAQERALDWTIRTAAGSRWGISPEGIHLGDVTLPAPLFGIPPGQRDEVNARLREWTEIQQQAQRAEARTTFDERVRAIRALRQAPPPDTLPPP